MTLALHDLKGCTSNVLAHYLKALGILRVVSEQLDSEARGWWGSGNFQLLTSATGPDLERFFLERYRPTPFLSPWNKGSGFFMKNDPALVPLEQSTAERFVPFRAGIAAGRAQVHELGKADEAVRALKAKTKAAKGMSNAQKSAAKLLKNDPSFKKELAEANKRFSGLKADLFTPCDLAWRGPHREWMEAAVVLDEEGKAVFPALLGTGGNDGRLDFTNNAMQRLGELFKLDDSQGSAQEPTASLLRQALWASPSNLLSPGAAIGQFLPGHAGGANSTTAPDGESLINAWDFVLMLEGSILFGLRATRRLDGAATRHASAPFAIRASSAGFGTAGQEKSVRGEQWMPLWRQPSCVQDVRALLGEARLQQGRSVAYRAIDVARAIARLGSARGITGFVRFGFLERNGQSNLAVPLGEIAVIARPRARLIDDLAPWLDRLQRSARDKNAPVRLVQVERRLADAAFAALTRDDSPARWQAVLLAAVAVEAVQAANTALRAGPIPELSPEWLAAGDDGSPEWRLAMALGSAAAAYDRLGRPVDSVRHHWLPLQPGARQFSVREKRLVRDARVVAGGRDPVGDLGALVERRLVEASQRASKKEKRPTGKPRVLPLVAAPGFGAPTADLFQLIGGNVELERVSMLARGLMAVRWDRVDRPGRVSTLGPRTVWPDEAWTAVRLASLPWSLNDERPIPTDHAMIRRLMAGDASGGVEIALRRLRSGGLQPPLTGAIADSRTAMLWAAALAFPIGRRQALAMARPFHSTNPKETK